MNYRPRIYFTGAQKALMWDHWQKGDSLETIARAFERGHSSVQRKGITEWPGAEGFEPNSFLSLLLNIKTCSRSTSGWRRQSARTPTPTTEDLW